MSVGELMREHERHAVAVEKVVRAHEEARAGVAPAGPLRAIPGVLLVGARIPAGGGTEAEEDAVVELHAGGRRLEIVEIGIADDAAEGREHEDPQQQHEPAATAPRLLPGLHHPSSVKHRRHSASGALHP